MGNHITRSRDYFLSLKQKDAKERQAGWASLTPEQQIASLDSRLGKGVGAVKQRARIARAMNTGK